MASGIQNLRTAAALADAGHDVLVWVDRIEPGGLDWAQEQIGRCFPPSLRLMQAAARGGKGQKRSAFSTAPEQFWHLARGRFRSGTPDAIITRSPTVVLQLRRSSFRSVRTKLILELQYPEWSFLWRDWSRNHPESGLAAGIRKLREFRAREAEGYGAADGILYAARAHERLLDRVGYTGPHAWIPSGADTPESDIRPESFEFDLGYVGSLAPENGLESLLEAVSQMPNVRLGILGGGRPGYVRGLEARVGELGITERVQFAGKVPPAEVRNWMRRCAIGVVPISARCGPEKRMYASPLKLIEWMAAGVPVVASRVKSNLQHEKAGDPIVLFSPDDADSLARTVREVLDDAAGMRKRAAEGLRAAHRRTFESRSRIVIDFAGEIGKGTRQAHGAT